MQQQQQTQQQHPPVSQQHLSHVSSKEEAATAAPATRSLTPSLSPQDSASPDAAGEELSLDVFEERCEGKRSVFDDEADLDGLGEWDMLSEGDHRRKRSREDAGFVEDLGSLVSIKAEVKSFCYLGCLSPVCLC